MSDCDNVTENCAACNKECGSRKEAFDMKAHLLPGCSVKHVVGVVSGKGGVGKSLVTALTAMELRKAGYKVGIMDADITGPSIGRMFGLKGPLSGNDDGVYPKETKEGIKVVSINFLLETEETPVIWRGPVIGNFVKQFWSEVIWGDLDYLLVDMPPGTGDVPLTVFQSLPVDGVVIVTTPQSLVEMIVKKAYNMADEMDIPVIGIVQNMSYVSCPDCGKKIYIYGERNIMDLAESLMIPSFAELPIEPEMAVMCDEGRAEDIKIPDIKGIISAIEEL